MAVIWHRKLAVVAGLAAPRMRWLPMRIPGRAALVAGAAGLSLLLAGTACTPRFSVAGPEVLEPSIGASSTGLIFHSFDGAELPVRVWWPSSPVEVSGPVLIGLHGFNDYSDSFDAPATWWATKGIVTYAFDQRGFGATDSAGFWAGSTSMRDDVTAIVTAVQLRHPGSPIYLVGVSMGGAVILDWLNGDARPAPSLIAGVVLVAPAVWGGPAMNPFYRASIWFAAHTVPWVKLTGRGLGIMPSDNIEMLRALGRDPLIIKETRIDTIYGLVSLMRAAQNATLDGPTPLLILYGAKDEVIPIEPTRQFLIGLDRKVRLGYYPNGFHMLLRDLQADTVWRDIYGWVVDPESALQSGVETGSSEIFLER